MQVDLYYDHQTVIVVAVSKSLLLLTKREHCIRTATVITAHNGKHKTQKNNYTCTIFKKTTGKKGVFVQVISTVCLP